MIRWACGWCGKRLKAPAEWAGRPARCHACGERMAVPADDSPVASGDVPADTGPGEGDWAVGLSSPGPSVDPLPPPLPRPFPATRPFTRRRPRRRKLPAVGLLVVLAVSVGGAAAVGALYERSRRPAGGSADRHTDAVRSWVGSAYGRVDRLDVSSPEVARVVNPPAGVYTFTDHAQAQRAGTTHRVTAGSCVRATFAAGGRAEDVLAWFDPAGDFLDVSANPAGDGWRAFVRELAGRP